MKKTMLVALLFIVGCGSDPAAGPCSSPLNGSWTRGDGDVFTFQDSCAFTYTLNTCTETGTYSKGDSLLLSVTTAGTCLPAGDTTCSYNLSGDLLVMECGWGQMTFGRN